MIIKTLLENYTKASLAFYKINIKKIEDIALSSKPFPLKPFV